MLFASWLAYAAGWSVISSYQRENPQVATFFSPQHTPVNSYRAAVAQTVWADGAGCCPFNHEGMGCPGAEPIPGLPKCTGAVPEEG